MILYRVVQEVAKICKFFSFFDINIPSRTKTSQLRDSKITDKNLRKLIVINKIGCDK